jgi:predicted RND superfamily exporter protein
VDRFAQGVIQHKRTVFSTFIIAAVICVILTSLVSVNYDLVDYLPKDAQSTEAIRIMEEEFAGEMPNARVMFEDVSIREALAYKEKLAAIEGVSSVSWLDDVIGLDVLETTPIELLDASIVEDYYKDKNALIPLTIKGGKEKSTMEAIYRLIGEDNAAAGEAVETAEIQGMSVIEVLNAMAILLPVILIILILTTTSWLEPLLYLFSIGVAVAINMGTNILFGEISFISYTVSPILQLAVSLDYAIFLLHSFSSHRISHEPQRAMALAIKEAFPTVAASAATTVIGFAALVFMRFGIGADLGMNLLKGVLLSFISVMVFLPVLTLMSYKVIDKTKHARLLPDFRRTGGWLMKIRLPFLILALVLVIPCFLAQPNTEFLYGMGSLTKASRVGQDTARIEEHFGKENQLVLLVTKENAGKESELCDKLAEIPHVTDVVSYVNSVGAEIPPEFVPEEVAEQFYSEHYSRIILYIGTAEEGEEAFDTVRAVLDTAAEHYDSYYLTGRSATLFDMKEVVSDDTSRINLVAIIGIFMVLLIASRSLILPFLLVFSIELAIWINLSVPYFAGQAISFVGYLIISTVQLGATVDYAILFTNAYLNHRKSLPKKEAMKITIGNNLLAILTSAGILAIAGFVLAFTTSNSIIAELGTLLGRGTLLSLTMVACVLPALLVLFDKPVQKTTFRNGVKD